MSQLPQYFRLVSSEPFFYQNFMDRIICVRYCKKNQEYLKSLLHVLPKNSMMIREESEKTFISFYANEMKSHLQEKKTSQKPNDLQNELSTIIDICQNPDEFTWRFCGGAFNLKKRTHVMGVLNITPDSFSDGGQFIDPKVAVEHGLNMIEAGVDFIDIGGESTRPGAQSVSPQEECDRVLPVISSLRRQCNIPISIDTYKSEVAEAAVQEGANIINDISGGNFDPDILSIARKYDTGLILMHIKGTPKNMQKNPSYTDVMEEILAYLDSCVEKALLSGLSSEQIVIDPGIGFGKRWFDNYDIINRLQELKMLKLPILIGASRKSFLGKFLLDEPHFRLEGSITANTLAICNGANIVRVHDVAETVRAIRIADIFYNRNQGIEPNILEAQFHG